ncbi:MAG: phosphoribosylformylglycinamidine synthase II, partial [Rhodospirillaceae bacterium]|nr:phosphoribosylformylglycinamidine synthase II [Rhodospirillaceae bacterium]
DPLALASPEYDRPWVPTPARDVLAAADVEAPKDLIDALKTLIGGANGCSKRWIWEQYDHMVMADTVQRPGGDAALVRVHGTPKALAMTSDVTPRYVFADPVQGGRQAVAESWRNLTATGATPMAITDNMNFGNPERPEIMGQFVGACEGISDACRALDFPVVSGNVSLYNETNGQGILPTPTIGGVGLIDDVAKAVGAGFTQDGEAIVLIGETLGHLGQSQYLMEVLGRDGLSMDDGAPPPVDLALERKNGDFVRVEILSGAATACHDLSDGGLWVALAEMALASDIGATIEQPGTNIPLHAWAFGEDQARYLVTTPNSQDLIQRAEKAGVIAAVIGTTGGQELTFGPEHAISLAELRSTHEDWLPEFMSHPDAH